MVQFKSTKLITILATIITASFVFGAHTQSASAASATDFDAGNIISDAVFYNKDAMSLAEIESFIKSHTVTCDTWGTGAVGGGRYINGIAVNPSTTRAKYAAMMQSAGSTRHHQPPYICLTNYYENPDTRQTSFDTGATKTAGMLSAAEIIYKAAQTYNINPQVLLVTLKKEYSYVYTDNWPLRDQYNTVMGYACPDSGPGGTANCDSKYYGFHNQIMNAAWQLNYYKEHIKSYNYQPYRTNYIQYSPDASCGTKAVYIQNVATASLYIYTPYTPNAGALAAYPGTANCGAYGNRNFFMFFNEWFGNTTLPVQSSTITTLSGKFTITSDITPGKSLGLNNSRLVLKSTTTEFDFEYQPDGFYLIRDAQGRYLAATGTNNGNKIDIQQDSNNACSQRWAISVTGSGYEIRSACSGRVLDVAGTNENTETVIWDSHNGANQKWNLTSNVWTANNGTYELTSNRLQSLYEGIINSNPNNGTKIGLVNQSQLFQLSRLSDGHYKITETRSGRALDVEGGTNNIILWDFHGGCNQRWSVKSQGEGWQIKSSCSGKVLDLAGTTFGTPLIIWEHHGGTNQTWTLTSKTQQAPTQTKDGIYTIRSTTYAGLYLDISATEHGNGGQVRLWNPTNNSGQKFQFTRQSDNTYKISDPATGKVLDAEGGGNHILIWDWHGGCNQRWRITNTEHNWEITSACDNRTFDLSGTSKGTPLILWERHGGPNQKWTLTTTQ